MSFILFPPPKKKTRQTKRQKTRCGKPRYYRDFVGDPWRKNAWICKKAQMLPKSSIQTYSYSSVELELQTSLKWMDVWWFPNKHVSNGWMEVWWFPNKHVSNGWMEMVISSQAFFYIKIWWKSSTWNKHLSMENFQVPGANSGIFFGDLLPLVEFGPQSHLNKNNIQNPRSPRLLK